MNDTPTTEIYTSGHTLSLPDSLPISTDPQLSQQIANAVAQTYIEDQVRLKNDVVADANSFLGSRMDELRAEEIGRAHVWTPVTNAHLVCRLLLEQKK